MKQKIITICSSASFYKEVLQIEKQLKHVGFRVLVPITARIMQKKNDFDVSHYKTWFKNAEDFKIKKKLMDTHFKKVIQADAILVINNEKHGISGYIGGNVLMEMVLAYHYKKPIYIFNDVSEKSSIYEEIHGLFPTFIHKDLIMIGK